MDQITEIKNKINIVDLISEFVPLKKTGRNFKGLCPFHTEKTPSFIVSSERQIWHCFGCSEGGNIFDFLMKIENIEFGEALRLLAKRAGVVLASYRPAGETQLKEKLYEINHLAGEFYHYLLVHHKIGEPARIYLQKRGIQEKIIEEFKIGFAPYLWQSVSKFLITKKGYQTIDLETAGLVLRGRDYYDRFRGRIIFPLIDHRGNTVGFSGRLLDPEAKEAKYINSPETPIYSKSHHLFGLNLAKDYIKTDNHAVIVEGEFDMISSYQAGIKNIVAIKGSALTEGHVSLLKRYAENLILALDTDFAGNNAAIRGIEIADLAGLNIRVASLLYGKDPDECVRKNPDLWKKSLQNALPIYDYLINFALSRFSKETPEGKRKISSETLPFIAKITNEIVKSHYIKKLANILEVSEEAVFMELNKSNKNLSRNTPFLNKSVIASPPAKSRQEQTEEILLSLIVQNPDINLAFQKAKSYLEADNFQTPILKKIYAALELLIMSGKDNFDLEIIIPKFPPEVLPAVDKLFLRENPEADKSEERRFLEIEKTAKILASLALKKNIRGIISQIKQAEQDNNEEIISELNKKFQLLSAKLKQLD